MTLTKIIDTLKMIALKHPNVNSAYEGNIYDILNAKPDNRYASVVITQQSHTTDEIYDHYGFVIFYVDRLVDDLEENRVQIQSIGKSMLGNIITAFCNEFDAECENISYQSFTQRFADETAGVYCTITIDTVKDVYCAERYWDESWSAPIVSIKNVDATITITENGQHTLTYDPTIYTGIGKVDIDVNVDVDSYYNRGYGVGYDQGKVDGVSEQKSKLETINITENGVYSNEDGYNHIEVNVPDLNGSYEEGYNQGYAEGEQVSYDKGYEQGQTDTAANARVLNVTENGNYLSKFSDPIIPTLVTGVYDDGTGYYSYAKLNGAVYNTKIAGSIDSRLEFWYKGDNMKSGDAYNLIIGSGNNDNSDCFQVRYLNTSNNKLLIEVGRSRITVNGWDDTVWHHLIISKAEGLWIDGDKKGDFSASNTINGEFFINSISYDVNGLNGLRTANGTFGMIKIDNVVIIPTADGFLNVNTGELLEIVQDGVYVFTDNEPKYGEGELYKTINVDVVPKINLQEAGIKLQNSTFTEIPKWVDFEGITDMDGLFSGCKNLTELPILNVPDCLNFSGVFSYVPFADLTNIQYWVYPKNANWNVAFQQNYQIERCSAIYMEGNDSYYQGTPFWAYSDLTNFTDFGGFIGLKYSITQDYALPKIPNLSYESCINVLNGLYDFTGNGETPGSNQGTLKVHQNFLDTVGEDILIGINKGWTITA